MASNTRLRAHLTEAFGWSAAEPIGWRTLAVAVLGIAVPVAVGLALGRLETGFTIGLGALLLASGPSDGSKVTAAEESSPASAILPAALAVGSATLIAGTPDAGPFGADVAMIALAGLAATVSGYSRPVGVAAIRFIVYLVLSVALLDSAGEHRGWAALVFGLGALWNVAIRLLLVGGKKDVAEAVPAAVPAKTPTPAQRRAYFRRTLKTLAGWQFTIRIVAGLAIACLLWRLWPAHHYAWIVLTVAILTQRALEHLPVKTTQRALGSLLGVSITWLILLGVKSPILLAGLVCVLGAGAALARARNYLAYAVLSTPVILLVMDFGRPVQMGLLTDRLAATVMGAAIVLGGNLLLDRALGEGARPAPRRTAA
jgi:hypothetical protein